jgi:hypothetical protein
MIATLAMPEVRRQGRRGSAETGGHVRSWMRSGPTGRMIGISGFDPQQTWPPLFDRFGEAIAFRSRASGRVLDRRRPLSILAVFLFAASSSHIVEREMHGCPKCRQQCGLVDLETWRVIGRRE